jgi:hypothetical protein
MRAVREINAVSLRRLEVAFVGAVVADPFELDNARPARPWISFYESRGPLSKQDSPWRWQSSIADFDPDRSPGVILL